MTVVDPLVEETGTALPHLRTDRLRLRVWLPALLFGIALLVVWEVICRAGHLPTYVLPAPSDIWTQVTANTDTIRTSAWVTTRNSLTGLVIGVIVGMVAAMLAVWIRPFDELLSPMAAAAAAIPIVAIAPIFYGMYSATQEMPRLLTVAVIVFFPIYVSCARGLRNISGVHADLMRSYAVGRWAITRTVRIPAAVGYLFTGLRVAAPNAVIAEIVAEYFGGLQNGIGYRITSAAAATNYALAWAFVFAAIVIGLLFFLVVVLIEVVATRRLSAPRNRADSKSANTRGGS